MKSSSMYIRTLTNSTESDAMKKRSGRQVNLCLTIFVMKH